MRGKEAAEEKFESNRCWFIRFNDRSHFHNLKVQVELVLIYKPAASYAEDVAKIIDEGGHAKQQILCVDGTALF